MGTYVYGDYCSGEIFAWNGSTQTLLDASQNTSAFGEDEWGELYVVGLGGSVSKIVPTVPCSFVVTLASSNFTAASGADTVAVTAAAGCGWTAMGPTSQGSTSPAAAVAAATAA